MDAGLRSAKQSQAGAPTRPGWVGQLGAPLAITMWDFSWLERCWPGAGYEDWGEALDQLVERGYDAVRIDAYPHLIGADPDREWELLPEWTTQDWGAPGRCRVKPWPSLARFIEACTARKVRVALSSWFREDTTDRRRALTSPEAHAYAWNRVLDLIRAEGLMEQVLFVDLCNEWPNPAWAKFYAPPAGESATWPEPGSQAWIRAATALVRARHPAVPLTLSHTHEPAALLREGTDLDLLEPHVWMAIAGEFYRILDYDYPRFDFSGWDRIALRAEPLYRSDPARWQAQLVEAIEANAAWSRRVGLPLVTTECWGVVDYRDWPMLDWGWVKELCELGTLRASATSRWAAMATSNFCGPQFRGMWRDIAWHQRLTRTIRSGSLPK